MALTIAQGLSGSDGKTKTPSPANMALIANIKATPPRPAGVRLAPAVMSHPGGHLLGAILQRYGNDMVS